MINSKEIFVGREFELAQTRKMLSLEQSQRVMSIHGAGGIGKTSLLHQIREISRQSGWLVTDVIDFFDTINHSLLGLLHSISQSLHTSEFEAFDTALLEAQRALPTERDRKEMAAVEKFVECYTQIQHPTALLLDTFEVIQGRQIEVDVLKLLPRIWANSVIFIAGRQNITSSLDTTLWTPKSLGSLSLEEAQEFAHKRYERDNIPYDIPKDAFRDIYSHAHGHPILIVLAVEWILEHAKPEDLAACPPDEFERQVVKWIRELKGPEEMAVLYMSVVDRRFDTDLLSYLLKVSLKEANKIFEKLARFSFVKYRPELEICTLHDEMRVLVDRYIGFQEGAKQEIAANVARYYPTKIDKSSGTKRNALQAEMLYYELLADLDKGFAAFEHQFEKAIKEGSLDFCSLLLEAVRDKTVYDHFTEEQNVQIDYAQGRFLNRTGQRVSAEKILQQASQRPGISNQLKADLLLSLSDNSRRDGNFRKAYEYAEISQSLLEKLDEKGSIEQGQLAQTYRVLGRNARSLSNFNKAEYFYKESLLIERFNNNQSGIAATLNDLGNVYRLLGNLFTARSCIEDGLVIRRELNQPREIGLSLMTLGLVSRDEGQIQSAIECFQEAIKIFQTIGDGDKENLASALRNLGDIFYWKEGVLYLEPEHYRRREVPLAFWEHKSSETISYQKL